jgi:broad specificity phosphatase PhoE
VTAVFFLVRHAAHDNVGGYLAGRAPAIHLGADGLAQAKRLGARMAQERFDAIYASPRERTQETAAAISQACGGMAVTTADELDEVDFGAWSGSTFDELNKLDEWQRWNSLRSMAETPTGETMIDVQGRCVRLLRRLARENAEGRMVLVTHADIIKSLVSHVLGLPIDAWPKLEISPASISTILVGPWGNKLLMLNETIS